MDLRTRVIVAALLLLTTGADEPTPSKVTSAPDLNGTVHNSSSGVAPAAVAPSGSSGVPKQVPVSGFLTIWWSKGCEGRLVFYPPYGEFSSWSSVCNDSDRRALASLSRKACEQRDVCEDKPVWTEDSEDVQGFHISEGRAEPRSSCKGLRVQCPVKSVDVPSSVRRQLQVFKVLTALLCCFLLLLLLLRFTTPTVRALQKRLSDRRQKRWIGPTQSHSVSYHRGKTTVKTNGKEQRLSYPALERLAMADGREPSSNRNSDFSF